MYRGLLGILTGICVGVIGSTLLALVLSGTSPLAASLFALCLSFPYAMILFAAVGYRGCRVTLWGLIASAALLAAPLMVLYGWSAYHSLTQPPVRPPRPGTMNCGPPAELVAALALMVVALVKSIVTLLLIAVAVAVGNGLGTDRLGHEYEEKKVFEPVRGW